MKRSELQQLIANNLYINGGIITNDIKCTNEIKTPLAITTNSFDHKENVYYQLLNS